MKKNNFIAILFMAALALLMESSCSSFESDPTDPCEDVICQNAGICQNGLCECTLGFFGDNCDVVDISQIQVLLDGGTTPMTLIEGGVSVGQLYGKTYEGGLIFYINTDDGTGMVAATKDQSMGAEWGCVGDGIKGADNKGLGFGVSNSMDILADCSTDGIAAMICDDLIVNDKDDWFLPSLIELGFMYKNLHLNGLGEFAGDIYWSSAEEDNYTAFVQAFSDVGIQSARDKSNLYYVRAARVFNK